MKKFTISSYLENIILTDDIQKVSISNLVALLFLAGEKFGFDARNATIIDGEGAEIDSIDVIRDNDKIFLVEEQSPYH